MYMQMKISVCFLDNAVFIVEGLVPEHNRWEVKEAKVKDMQNIDDYETFELVRCWTRKN